MCTEIRGHISVCGSLGLLRSCNKIVMQLEKEVDNENYWISNILFNKEQNNNENNELELEDKFMFSNIQQLRKFIQEEFKKINLD